MEVIGIAAVVALILFCLFESNNQKKPDPRDLRIGRNSNGTYYVYDKQSGVEFGTFPNKEEAAAHLKAMKSNE